MSELYWNLIFDFKRFKPLRKILIKVWNLRFQIQIAWVLQSKLIGFLDEKTKMTSPLFIQSYYVETRSIIFSVNISTMGNQKVCFNPQKSGLKTNPIGGELHRGNQFFYKSLNWVISQNFLITDFDWSTQSSQSIRSKKKLLVFEQRRRWVSLWKLFGDFFRKLSSQWLLRFFEFSWKRFQIN